MSSNQYQFHYFRNCSKLSLKNILRFWTCIDTIKYLWVYRNFFFYSGVLIFPPNQQFTINDFYQRYFITVKLYRVQNKDSCRKRKKFSFEANIVRHWFFSLILEFFFLIFLFKTNRKKNFIVFKQNPNHLMLSRPFCLFYVTF